jgi:hypothetical protein
MRAVIKRTKIHVRNGRFAWNWLYSVSLDGAQSVEIGYSLAGASSWAKQRGATHVVKTWGHSQVNATREAS